MHTREEKLQAFGRILDVLDELREKCPWDRKQTNESLRPQTIEEVYELNGAILAGDERELSKELGDVLLHVLFYAKIGEEKQTYDIVDVINFLCDKLIYRHPHVFSTAQVGGAEDVIKQWEMLKTKEKDGNKTVLSGVPEGLPPLLKAYRMQDKARGVGFDWEKKEDVWETVKEELGEYQAELLKMKTDARLHMTAQRTNSAISCSLQSTPRDFMVLIRIPHLSVPVLSSAAVSLILKSRLSARDAISRI